MVFILLTFIAAFSIEALGTYVSIIGLSTLFGSNPIIMAIAVALDVGKLLVVSMLYTYWNRLGFLMKSYALIASIVTMTITSAGAMGYLSGEFQKAIMGSQENTLKVDVLKSEQGKLEARKQQIDQQIAELPKNYSSSRIKLMKEFSGEQEQITNRLTQINKDLPELQIAQIGVEAKVGPILYISKAFDVPVEVAVKWVILMIVFVFDPLAVFLIITGNFLLHLRRTHKEASMASADLFEEEPSVPKREDAILPVQPTADQVFEEPSASPTSNDLEVSRTQDEWNARWKTDETGITHPKAEVKPESDLDTGLKFRIPDPEREIITLSSLGRVRPDPKTIVSLDDDEVGLGTKVYKTGHKN